MPSDGERIASYLRGKSIAQVKQLLVDVLRNLSEAHLKATTEVLLAEVDRRKGTAIAAR